METRVTPEQFATWLTERMRHRDMTPADLAKAMGVRPGTVHRWVTGKQKPAFAYAARIADALRMRAETVQEAAGYEIGGEDEASPLRAQLLWIAGRVPEDRLPWAISALDAIRTTDVERMRRIADERAGRYGSESSEE